nr:helix-turn-helix domain-containing protein [Tannerella forsythia]
MHYNHLTREHRYAIYLGSEEGKRHEAIARQINVHPSSICVKTCCKSIFFCVVVGVWYRKMRTSARNVCWRTRALPQFP